MRPDNRSAGRWLGVGVLAAGLVGCGLIGPGAPTPTSPEVPSPAPISSPTATPFPPAASPSPPLSSPASPSPSPAATDGRTTLAVLGTGRDGLAVRREPGGEQIGLVPEGQAVTDLGEERAAAGRAWRRVRVPASAGAPSIEGWAAAEFLVPASAASPLAVPTAAPGPGAAAGAAGPSAGSAPPATGAAPAATIDPRHGYVARSPEYGLNVFLAGNAATTARDLVLLNRIEFGWQKSLFQWRQIEGAGKGVFDWRDSDRVVAASRQAGIKIIARLDFQPGWARADGASNGPPSEFRHYADFVRAFVQRYRSGSPLGTVHAVEIWNEPNLAREWGGARIDADQAADYVRLLALAYDAAKSADPSVTVVSAGLSPTCTDDAQARPDDVYLQWMYDAGAQPYFDVLGAHGAGYDKPPDASPDDSAARHNGCRVFAFRRVEDLRAVMVRNGDAAKQVWLLEFGWTTDRQNPAYAWHAVSPEAQGEYIVAAYQWAHRHWSPWIGVMALWNLPDPNWGRDREEYWWGIANPDGSARPALARLLAARRDGQLP